MTRGLSLRTKDAHGWRPSILLVVVLLHVVIVFLLVRGRPSIFPATSGYDPLVVIFLRDKTRATADGEAAPNAAASPHIRELDRGKHEPLPEAAIAPPPEALQPKIDWNREAELAAQNAAADSGKDYRDLSQLSPSQQSWIKQNHMEPVPPGISWRHPRVEFTADGFPIIWINDHCVSVPAMMFLVFCHIGHIEANGDLFKHMHDPAAP
jgi:hypothetical protein